MYEIKWHEVFNLPKTSGCLSGMQLLRQGLVSNRSDTGCVHRYPRLALEIRVELEIRVWVGFRGT